MRCILDDILDTVFESYDDMKERIHREELRRRVDQQLREDRERNQRRERT